ncbi:MFS transporter [Dactylosporangium sp. NPDC049742]|uniref:MFS transporter n=1 Tax=Dactylosporangium sp. NPDC049742 TaxID=3154737 RepID=UPI003432DA61
MATHTQGPEVKATRREWLGLAVLGFPSMLGMIDISVLFLALPNLTADLDASASQQLWIGDIYGFLSAGFLVTMGTLGDRIGRRKLLVIGATAFGLVSAVAAFSTTPEMLIVCRALLGIAGATLIPSTLALITQMFKNPKEMGIAIAVWASALTLGVALGPVVGGVLLQWFWWGSVFLIGPPVMLLVVATARVLLPEFKDPNAGRLDLFSVALSLLAILPVIYAFKELAANGWTAIAVVTLVGGLVFGAVFVHRQRKLADPLLDVRLFKIKAVSGALVLALLIGAVQGGAGFFLAQFLQVVEGRSPLSSGLWILVPTFALLIGIGMSQGIAQKVRPAYVVAGGAVIAAIGMTVLSQLTVAAGLSMLIVGFSIVFFGVSPVGPVVSQLVVPAAPPEKAGSASSLQTTSGDLGVAVGIATMGSIGAAVYSREMVVPPEIANTPAGAAAAETADGALFVAQSLPGAVGDALVAAARTAFTTELNTVAAVCGVVFVGLAVLSVATLRGVPPMAGQGGGHGHGAPAETVEDTPAPDTEKVQPV